ncbi:MAG: hypothetical protein FWC09_08550, partial [Lachnospiraceae bacterium]|nr:hypothetical protein [Lachnospiraceae bacterium]
TPPVGVICHIGQYLIRTLSRKPKEIPLDEVGFSKERHGRLIEPDKETEMQKVPLEELFLISTDVEKRKHLLNELKKETAINYGTITKALDNEDPESAHYAAAALANVKAEYENELRDYDNRYNRNNENTKLCREYAGRTRDFLDSGILTGIELKRYNYLIINLLSGIPQNGGTLNNDDYVSIVKSAIFNGEYEIAKKWALECHELLPSEISFLHLLKIYYDTGLTENFFSILDDLKKSEVSLTEEGLNLVRYFLRPVQV